MSDKNKITNACIQLYALLAGLVFGKNAEAHIRKLSGIEEMNILTIDKTNKVLKIVEQGGNYTSTWIKYLLGMLGMDNSTSGNSGFNTVNAKSGAIAIFKKFGVVDGDGKLPVENTKRTFLHPTEFAKKLAHIFEEVVEEAFGVGSAEESEFAFVSAQVQVADSVSDFNPLSASIMLEAVLTTFLGFIATCGNVGGKILNFRWVNTQEGKVSKFRPAADEAIANGASQYTNGRGKVKQLTSLQDMVGETNFVQSLFTYQLMSKIVLKALHFKTPKESKETWNNLIGFMKGANFGEKTHNACRFLKLGMMMINNAVENGANKSDIGVGFAKYLDDEVIWSVVGACATDSDEFFERYRAIGSGGSRTGFSLDIDSLDQPLL